MGSIELRRVLEGGLYYEAPRWRAGRLWFVDCLARTLLSIDPSGRAKQHATFAEETPCGIGLLPNGRLVVLTMLQKRLLAYADDRLSLYADLSRVAAGTIEDMIIDAFGRAYVGDLGFDLPPPVDRGAADRILLVMPDGRTSVVAEGLRFPNGIAVAADHRRLVVAEMDGDCLAEYDIGGEGELHLRRRFGRVREPDGICLDRDGAVWAASFGENAFVCIDRDGQERQRIATHGRRAIACAFGGSARQTLFCLSAATSPEELRRKKSTAVIDAVDLPIGGAGFP
jgi:sugar lactone lactonase YvrE